MSTPYWPEDPPGIDADSNGMPSVEDAAERVIDFVCWFGDGRILVALDEQGPPLYARDLEALARLVPQADHEPAPEAGASGRGA